tara:strand:- start:1005 stop:1775 length:771 start_codon:yes stop_codon:yes gene_type:complete
MTNLLSLTQKSKQASESLFKALETLSKSFDALELEHGQLTANVVKLRKGDKEWRKQNGILSDRCASLNATLEGLKRDIVKTGKKHDETKKAQTEELKQARLVVETEIASEKVEWNKKKRIITEARTKIKLESDSVQKSLDASEKIRKKLGKREEKLGRNEEICRQLHDKLTVQKDSQEKERISLEKQKLGLEDTANALVEKELLKREAELRKKKRDLFFISRDLKGRLEVVKKRELAIKRDRLRLEDRIKTFEAHS